MKEGNRRKGQDYHVGVIVSFFAYLYCENKHLGVGKGLYEGGGDDGGSVRGGHTWENKAEG